MLVAQQQTSGKAVAALILGLCVLLVGVLTGIPAVILGHMALGEINSSGGMKGGKGMAITGLVFGYISIAGVLILCLIVVASSLARQ